MNEPTFRDQTWQRWRVKDGEKGPILWEEKHARLTPKDEDGMPGEPMHLVVARNVLNVNEVKFFASNAPEEIPVQKMLLVGFSRWRVERCFEDQKSEIGLDQYEGRRYQGLKRHLILSCVSSLFLSRMREEFGGGNRDLTVCQVHTAIAALIPSWWLEERPSAKLLERTAEEIRRTQKRNAAARKGHTKATRKKLRALGIKLTEVRRCVWGKTWRCSIKGRSHLVGCLEKLSSRWMLRCRRPELLWQSDPDHMWFSLRCEQCGNRASGGSSPARFKSRRFDDPLAKAQPHLRWSPIGRDHVASLLGLLQATSFFRPVDRPIALLEKSFVLYFGQMPGNHLGSAREVVARIESRCLR